MRWRKKYWARLLLGFEIFLFSYFCWFGNEGFLRLHKIQQDNNLIEVEVRQLIREINKLTQEIESFKRDPYFREKLAREELQMARKNEEIYFDCKKKES